MLHQGTAQHPRGNFERSLFTERTTTRVLFHNNIIDNALDLDVVHFVDDMVDSALAWLATAESTATYQQNFPQFVQRYPEGFAPIIGIPVIT